MARRSAGEGSMRGKDELGGMQRVSVVGTSGSGKTHFARRLAKAIGAPHVGLDDLYWLPDWVERSVPDFRARVQEATAPGRWVIDGNYSKSRDIVWGRATHVIWLNYSFPVVFTRAFSRTVHRAATGKELFAGNRESWSRAFLSHDSMLIWVLATFRHNRVKYAALRESAEWKQLRFMEFRRSRDASAFISRCAGGANGMSSEETT